MDPTIGRIVIYRSRTGSYDVPAIVTATTETLNPKGVEFFHATNGEKGVPPLSSDQHVHLTVFTPGLPGYRAEGLRGELDTPLAERDASQRGAPAQGYGENAGGSYQEWDVPPADEDDVVAPGTWRWPEIRR